MRTTSLTFICCLFILIVPSTTHASATPAPDLTRIAANIQIACWFKNFPIPNAFGYFQSSIDGRTENVGGPDGINLDGVICKRLRRVIKGWRPKSNSEARQMLAWDISVLSHEMGHATAQQRGEDLWDERLADAYGRGPEFERVNSRLGIGPYLRRQLRRELEQTGRIYN